ncbi:hypothetical protein KAR91_05385 [Candidatus Pacearchaeota archaeon]|nr:hypothetical protein [Candidatus Pacearchaeota archaeon]
MLNPNKEASAEVLIRLKEASEERMRAELLVSVELKMKDFDMSWDDLGKLLGEEERTPGNGPSRADIAKWKIVQGQITLKELNALTHLFSCEPYIIFRPREPWTRT